MKRVLFTIASFLVLVTANAKSLNPTTFQETSEFTSIQVDPGLLFSTVESGSVTLDKAAHKIKLTLHFKNLCPTPEPGDMGCSAQTPEDFVLTLPIVSVGKSEDGCEATIYRAEIDHTQGDGTLSRITLEDLRSFSCKMKIPADEMTHVEYLYVMPRTVTGAKVFTSNFLGTVLK